MRANYSSQRLALILTFLGALQLGCGTDDTGDDGKGTPDAAGQDAGPCAPDQPCDDGDPCTVDDLCGGDGVCKGEPRDCDDDNPCTEDSCDPGSASSDAACIGEPVEGACDDGSACTTGETCSKGVCAGQAVKCTDDNPCTTDSCDPKSGCVFDNDDKASCDDGDACTVGDLCAGGACKPGAPKTCEAPGTCELATCDSASGKCATANSPDGAACDDGDACTLKDACEGGLCVGTATDCDDDNACTLDTCDTASGKCAHDAKAMDGKGCEDGSVCTNDDLCADGKCVAGAAVDCSDANPCTTDSCDLAKGCTSTDADGAPCDDGDKCTAKDSCLGGKCVAGTPACACTTDADCKKVDDGNPCNGTLVCVGSGVTAKCQPAAGSVVTCPASTNPCADLVCQPSSGKCETKAKADGVPCDADGSVCTQSDACKAGSCEAGAALGCDDGKPCTKDLCDASKGCQSIPDEGAPCDDGLACTEGDSCKSGNCAKGVNKSCDDNKPCTTDSCDPKTGQCLHVAVADGSACDADGSVCTVSDACDAGVCKAGKLKVCDDANKCTDDICDAKTGCAFPINAGACDDGDACTVEDNCVGGSCKAGKVKVCDDGDKCTTDSCNNKKGCQFTAISGCFTTPPTWTVLVYMAADNNLEPNALDDIGEMLKVTTSAKFRFVIQIDRSKAYSSKGVGGVGDFTTTRRFVIESTGKLKQIKDLGETNTGDAATLQAFIKWGVTTYPADRVGLVMWNHGNAWQGFGGDEDKHPHDLLTLTELSQALTNGAQDAKLKSFDFIGFDACLMGTLTVAKLVQPLTRWLIASADLEPGHGWDWTAFDKLSATPSAPMTTFGPELLNAFKQQSKDENTFASITLALYDLDQLAPVDALVTKMTYDLGKDLSKTAVQLGRARQKALDYGRDQVITKSYHMADIGHFAQQVSNELTNYAATKDELTKALAKLVVAEVHGPVTADTTGLSLYFPPAKALYANDYKDVSGVATWRNTLSSFHTWADTYGIKPKVIRADSGSGGKAGGDPNAVLKLPKRDEFRCGGDLSWWETKTDATVNSKWTIHRSSIDNKCRLMFRAANSVTGCTKAITGSLTTPWLDMSKLKLMTSTMETAGSWPAGAKVTVAHSGDGSTWINFDVITKVKTYSDVRSLKALYPKGQKFKLRFTMTVPGCLQKNQPGPEIDSIRLEPVVNACLGMPQGPSCDQDDLVQCDGKGLVQERKACQYGCKEGAKVGQAACEGEVTGVPGEVDVSCKNGVLTIKANIQKEFIASAVEARLRFGHFGSYDFYDGVKPSKTSYLYTPLVFGERPASIAADGKVTATWDQKVLVATHDKGQTIFHARAFPTAEVDHFEAPVMVVLPKDNPCPCLKAGQVAYGDMDKDGVPNCLDRDVDGDGILNHLDNCPYFANAKQADGNNDGVGNACTTNGKPLPNKGKPVTSCEPTPTGRFYTGVLFLDFKPGTTTLIRGSFYARTETGISEVTLPDDAVVHPLTRISEEVSAYAGLPPQLKDPTFGKNQVFQPMEWKASGVSYKYLHVSEVLWWKAGKPVFGADGRPIYLADNYEINDLYMELVVKGVGDKFDSLIYKGAVPEGCLPPLTPCPSGKIRDCRGVCVFTKWLGNNVCDDGDANVNGMTSIDLNCARLGYDNGDCSPCKTKGYIRDCRGRCHPPQVIRDALGDGICHNGAHIYEGSTHEALGTGPDLACASHSFDLGDCAKSSPFNRQKCSKFDHDWTCDGVCLSKQQIRRELFTVKSGACRSRYNCAKYNGDAGRCQQLQLPTLICSPSCKNGGKCSLGRCQCPSSWTGADCTVPRATGACCKSNSTPRCNDAFVSSCVCSRRPSCCLKTWDARCAEIAQNSCAANCGALTACADSKCAQPAGAWVGEADVGPTHGCAVDLNGKVRCWGSNIHGQLARTGKGSATPQVITKVPGKAYAIATGHHFSASLSVYQTKTYLKTWGLNDSGQLGNGGTTSTAGAVASRVLADGAVVGVGERHACYSAAKKTFCWGDNSFGQVGNGAKSATPVTKPTEVKALSGLNVVAFGLGNRHSCALLGGGGVRCWGSRADGAIGDGLTGSTWTNPQKVKFPTTTKATAIAAGKQHSCAVAGGKLWCWGRNLAGQLGQSAASKTYASPVEVKDVTETVTDVAVGDFHTCAALKSGAAMCFGGNFYRQLGSYLPTGYTWKPAYVVNGPADKKLSQVGSVLAGGRSSCAVVGLQSGVGTLSCWGENNYSQLALGYGGDLVCDPQCIDKACGEGCNDAIRCGKCGASAQCDDAAGQCKACKGSCTGRECGSDGCDGWCGSCPSGKKCSSSGKCVPTFGCGGACTNTWLTKDGSLCSCNPKCGTNGQPPCCGDKGKNCGP